MMAVSCVREDAVLSVASGAVFAGGDRDAKDGGGSVHAGVSRSGSGAGTEGGAGCDVLEGGGEGVSAEDVEGVGGRWFWGWGDGACL